MMLLHRGTIYYSWYSRHVKRGDIIIIAQMPSPLDQDRASHEPEQTLAALDASAHPGGEPLASFEQQPGLQAGVGTAL